MKQTVGNADNNHHLTTKELDPDTGLYYFYARWYDSERAQFISKDKEHTINLYLFCANNPIVIIDPNGKKMFSLPGDCLKRARELRQVGRKVWPDEQGSNMRHCVSSCALAHDEGHGCAFAAGWYNELNPKGVYDPQDVVANREGRGCSDCESDCVTCCKHKFPQFPIGFEDLPVYS